MVEAKSEYRELEEMLGYDFADQSLLRRALTHKSFTNENDIPVSESYEVLEFLGDAVLGLKTAEILYERFPEANEGTLSELRIDLVKGRKLAKFAGHLNLARWIRVGNGLSDDISPSILEDVLEAITGAIHIDSDGNGKVTRKFVEKLMALDTSIDNKEGRDTLLKWLDQMSTPHPTFNYKQVDGPPHKPTFECHIEINGIFAAKAEGSSKKDAANLAAASALKEAQTNPGKFQINLSDNEN